MTLSWWNIAIFLSASLGHAALVVALLNRLLSLRISEAFGHYCKAWHDAVILLFPLAVGWFYGLWGPRAFFGGSWGETPWLVGAYFYLCAVTGIVDPLIMLVRTNWPRPRALRRETSERFDYSKDVPQPPFGEGPHRRMALVPFNEALTVEFSEKELALAGLPAEWDGLSLLHISDTHFVGVVRREWFARVFEEAARHPVDLVVFTGDLLDDPALVEWIPDTFGRLDAPLGKWFLLGNHDWMTGRPEVVRQALRRAGWRDASSATVLFEHLGRTLAIAGSELPWMGERPDWSGVPEGAFRLALAHSPDEIGWARRHRADLLLAGHNHGGQIRFPFFGPVYSPSWHGCRYSGGTYHVAPTVMHVSRGLSGRHPLRIRCAPEVTRLVLRCEKKP